MDEKKATETVTIPMAEYIYLTRVDALMDVIINDASYGNSTAVTAVADAVKQMRGLVAET